MVNLPHGLFAVNEVDVVSTASHNMEIDSV